ncbi:hypothetical protein NFX46_05335 [Streptomyces phaeoluteigriseus]|uniref:Uncharacterized protein n=1 Tax=Streptomyces phaeoluteigriseus TaxID=114686 RepID=A0ABY4Z3Y3_9ACTN|nr:hypothetical protein [Streptomyces phaeoluteigriseus]USQ83255.1 hypothetical protein NFX46_05335 [Streptomyces phaeoluteigriseus]
MKYVLDGQEYGTPCVCRQLWHPVVALGRGARRSGVSRFRRRVEQAGRAMTTPLALAR